jgi:hypothetical protein
LVREHLEKLECRNRALGHGATPWLRGKNGTRRLGSQVYNSPKNGFAALGTHSSSHMTQEHDFCDP